MLHDSWDDVVNIRARELVERLVERLAWFWLKINKKSHQNYERITSHHNKSHQDDVISQI